MDKDSDFQHSEGKFIFPRKTVFTELEYKITNGASHIEGSNVRVHRTLTIFPVIFHNWEDKEKI